MGFVNNIFKGMFAVSVVKAAYDGHQEVKRKEYEKIIKNRNNVDLDCSEYAIEKFRASYDKNRKYGVRGDDIEICRMANVMFQYDYCKENNKMELWDKYKNNINNIYNELCSDGETPKYNFHINYISKLECALKTDCGMDAKSRVGIERLLFLVNSNKMRYDFNDMNALDNSVVGYLIGYDVVVKMIFGVLYKIMYIISTKSDCLHEARCVYDTKTKTKYELDVLHLKFLDNCLNLRRGNKNPITISDLVLCAKEAYSTYNINDKLYFYKVGYEITMVLDDDSVKEIGKISNEQYDELFNNTMYMVENINIKTIKDGIPTDSIVKFDKYIESKNFNYDVYNMRFQHEMFASGYCKDDKNCIVLYNRIMKSCGLSYLLLEHIAFPRQIIYDVNRECSGLSTDVSNDLYDLYVKDYSYLIEDDYEKTDNCYVFYRKMKNLECRFDFIKIAIEISNKNVEFIRNDSEFVNNPDTVFDIFHRLLI